MSCCYFFVYENSCPFSFFFFFQAEDGIRDPLVTGVQTCALPISAPRGRSAAPPGDPAAGQLGRPGDAGRAGAAAAPSSLAGPVHPAADAAALASRPGPTPLDLPPSAWPSGSGGRAPRVGT